jgi:GNAT superfamily N-acetyltransferase
VICSTQELPTDFLDSLSKILTKNRRNEWVEHSAIKVYLRIGRRYLDGEPRLCLDMASVEIEPEFQGKGWFSLLMEFLCVHTPTDYVYIENTLNPILKDWCIRHGWIADNVPLCFYKKVHGEEV